MALLSDEPMKCLDADDRRAIRRAFDALPEEARAQIVDGDIIVSPLRLNAHQRVIMDMNELLTPRVRDDWWVDASGGLIVEPEWDEYRPDLIVAPKAAWKAERGGPVVAEVKLVMEVSSPGKWDLVRDRETKYGAYANAGVPLYLLVDRYEGGGFTTLYSKPFDREYLEKVKVPFGGKLSLPAPFGVEIDTAEF